MMTKNTLQYARAGAAAIAAVMALSPIHAAPPKPIIDLSQSPALSEEKPTATPANTASNGNETMMELGGGTLALLILGGGALAFSRRKRKREEESWQYESRHEATEPAADAEPMALSQRIVEEEPAMVAPPLSAFDWGNEQRLQSPGGDCAELESWTERAKCGPTADNPSQSLKKRMKRAAFFEKRDREVAAGKAAPIDPDAGLPENLEESEVA